MIRGDNCDSTVLYVYIGFSCTQCDGHLRTLCIMHSDTYLCVILDYICSVYGGQLNWCSAKPSVLLFCLPAVCVNK